MYHDPQPQTIMHLADENDLNNIGLACDSDYGGSSRIDLDISPDRGDGSERWAICKGRISLAVRKEVRGKVRSGWVGFRTLVSSSAQPDMAGKTGQRGSPVLPVPRPTTRFRRVFRY